MITSRVKWPKSGRYLLAVSGGADSMTLLDLMARAKATQGYQLIVAHFDHGMRAESGDDQEFVSTRAHEYGLAFDSHEANLLGANEAKARSTRYVWLEAARAQHKASAIITAHHEDDLIETSLLNLARGTGRRGLAPMQSGPVLRPLLAVPRAELRRYAQEHKLTWREDKTNANITNPRNFLRHVLLPAASARWRRLYLENLSKMANLNKKIDQSIVALLAAHKTEDNGYSFPRVLVRDLALSEVEELLMSAALALDPGIELDRRVVSEVALFAKTGRPGTYRPLRQHVFTGVQTHNVRVYYMGIQGRR